jgi:hypothetical protein
MLQDDFAAMEKSGKVGVVEAKPAAGSNPMPGRSRKSKPDKSQQQAAELIIDVEPAKQLEVANQLEVDRSTPVGAVNPDTPAKVNPANYCHWLFA